MRYAVLNADDEVLGTYEAKNETEALNAYSADYQTKRERGYRSTQRSIAVRVVAALLLLILTSASAYAAIGGGGVGTRCSNDSQCRVGLVCNSRLGSCYQLGSVGTPCYRNAECRSPLYCSNRTWACQQR